MKASGSTHLRIIEDIARDLSGDINFPTCLDAALSIRNALRDPFASLERVAQAIGVEPLISSKLLRLANSAAYNPAGQPVTNIVSAIGRLGFEVVRTTSLAVALDQLLKAKPQNAHAAIGQRAWEHSLTVAAIARVLARRLGRISPDEAMLAGLVHDIGVFYLLYRACGYAEYRDNEAALLALLGHWHEEIGENLLLALGLPERIVDAIHGIDHLHQIATPCSVGDVLYFANLLAGGDQEWLPDDLTPQELVARDADRLRYAELLAEAQADIAELRQALAA